MIITRLTAGLGNQMFQYAAGLALATRKLTVLKLDVSGYGIIPGRVNHETYSLSCFNIIEQFATATEVAKLVPPIPSRIKRAIRKVTLKAPPRSRRYSQAEFTFESNFESLPDNTYLEGTWQCDKYFESVTPFLRRHFTFKYPLPASADAMMQRITQDPSSVSVHFRRGDFITSQTNVHNRPLDLDYYRRAIEKLMPKVADPCLYIFSDDIRAIAREFKPDCRHVFVEPEPDWQAYDELRMMSMCRHNIIANSTFSWWAGWLNSFAGKMVIAPEPWFANKTYDGSQVVPDAWTRLPVRHLVGAS